MNCDTYFAIGKQHTICQDYGRVIPEQNLIVVSDGCSSSTDTDIGARFLVRGLELAYTLRRHGYSYQALQLASHYALTLGFKDSTLDATLLYAYPEGTDIRVVAHGDGVIAARRKDGTLDHWVIECPKGAPDYLSYHLDEARLETYTREIREHKTCTVHENGKPVTVIEYTSFDPVTFLLSLDTYNMVALFTDGIRSFLRKTGTTLAPVPDWDVIQQVMAIQNTNGEYVVRKIRNGFLGRFCAQNEWQHYDDFAMAAMAVEESK